LAAAATAAIVVLRALAPTIVLDGRIKLRNPIGFAWFPDPERGALGAAVGGLFALCIGAAVLSLVLRLRRSHGVERQQLKWFTYAGALLFPTIGLVLLFGEAGVLGVLAGVGIALVPVAAGIAILRHRLYDIDVIINRTLVYGLLATGFTAVYLLIVVGI